jgi:type II secretory pathway pseudopilin PulG
MAGLVKLTAASAIILVLAGIAAVVLVPPAPPARQVRRHAQARLLMDRLAEAARAYRQDRGHFPPGDGSGSVELVRALGGFSKEGVPYFIVPAEMLTPQGDVRNPMDPGSSILHYRARPAGPEPWAGGEGFDLWCRSPEGEEAGVSDWAPAVSSP